MGCERSIESACEEFPRVEHEMDLQRLAFSDVQSGPENKGRKPASVSAGKYSVSEDQRQAWLKWTEDLLKRSQWVRDSFEGDSKRRPALKAMEEASLTLVTLHGFLEQGKMKKAVATLDQLKRDLRAAYDRGCVVRVELAPKIAERVAPPVAENPSRAAGKAAAAAAADKKAAAKASSAKNRVPASTAKKKSDAKKKQTGKKQAS